MSQRRMRIFLVSNDQQKLHSHTYLKAQISQAMHGNLDDSLQIIEWN